MALARVPARAEDRHFSTIPGITAPRVLGSVVSGDGERPYAGILAAEFNESAQCRQASLLGDCVGVGDGLSEKRGVVEEGSEARCSFVGRCGKVLCKFFIGL